MEELQRLWVLYTYRSVLYTKRQRRHWVNRLYLAAGAAASLALGAGAALGDVDASRRHTCDLTADKGNRV
jgi:hypothetical protein